MIFVWTILIVYAIVCLLVAVSVVATYPVIEQICADKVMKPKTAAVLITLLWPLVIYYILQERGNKKKRA